MIKKIIFIFLALFFIISMVNKIDFKPHSSIPETVGLAVNDMIGCEDYSYKFDVNVPVNAIFYVTKSNGEDEMGFFKKIDALGNYSTILHCGNNYHVIYSAPGYKDYEEDIINTGFRPSWSEPKQIIMEKQLLT